MREQWKRIVEELRRLVPLRGVVLYGSGVRSDRGRDYDVLAVTDEAEAVDRRDEVERMLRGTTGLAVDLNIATPKGLRIHELADPYVWHVLATGVLIGDVPRTGLRLSQRGAWHALLTIRILLEDADSLGLQGRERAEWLRPVAKQVAALEQSLAGRADPEAYAQRVDELESEAVLHQAVAELERRVEAYPANEADDVLAQELAPAGSGGR